MHTARSRRLLIALFGLALAIGAGAGVVSATTTPAPAHASAVNGPLTRSEVMDRAQYWVDQEIVYGTRFVDGEAVSSRSASDSDGHSYRTDCSGLVAMAWHLSWSPTTGDFHDGLDGVGGFTGTTVLSGTVQLKPGDAVLFSGHIELFAGWKNNNDHTQGAWAYSLNGPIDADWAKGPYTNSHGEKGELSWSALENNTLLRYDDIIDDSSVVTGDVNGDGLADIVATKADGTMWYYVNGGDPSRPYGAGLQIGTGWGMYDRITVGDVTGDGFADVIATKPDGTLWYYGNNFNSAPTHPYGAGSQIGSGWGMFDRIALGDVNGDPYTDIVATKPDGTMWFYRNDRPTNPSRPYGSGLQIGTGWGMYDRITVGDVTADGYGDVIATKPDGTLWYYGNNFNANPAKPYGAGSQVGSAWAGFTRINLGDVDGDAYTDIVGIKANGTLWFYKNNRAVTPSQPYGTGVQIGTGWNMY